MGLAVFVWIFGSLFVDQVKSFIGALPEIADNALAWFNKVTGSDVTFDTILDRLGITPGDIAAYADDVALGVLNVIGAILSGFFGLFILLFFVFYVSAGMPRLRRWIARRMRPDLQVPFLAAWDLTRHQGRRLHRGPRRAGRGQLDPERHRLRPDRAALLAAPGPVDRHRRPVRARTWAPTSPSRSPCSSA